MSKRLYTRFHDLLTYNPTSGLLRWKHNGKVAGSASKGKPPLNYVQVGIDGMNYLGHRVVWLMVHGEWPSVVDHYNGDGADNSLENLSDGSQSANMQNVRKRVTNTSGVTGVSYCAKREKWQAYINIRGKRESLGRFPTLREAIAARKTAERLAGYSDRHGK